MIFRTQRTFWTIFTEISLNKDGLRAVNEK